MKWGNVKAGPAAVVSQEVEARSVPVRAVHPRLGAGRTAEAEDSVQSEGKKKLSQRAKRSQWKFKSKLRYPAKPPKASQRSCNRTGIAREEGKIGCVALRAAVNSSFLALSEEEGY